MWSGSRPTSSANMQKTRRLTRVRDRLRFVAALASVWCGSGTAPCRDNQQRRVLQRQRVLPELVERRVEVRTLPLVLPGEVVPLPDVGPTVAASVLLRAPLEAVRLPGRVRLGWRRLAQQTAQVDSSASSETDLNRLTSTLPRISVTLDREEVPTLVSRRRAVLACGTIERPDPPRVLEQSRYALHGPCTRNTGRPGRIDNRPGDLLAAAGVRAHFQAGSPVARKWLHRPQFTLIRRSMSSAPKVLANEHRPPSHPRRTLRTLHHRRRPAARPQRAGDRPRRCLVGLEHLYQIQRGRRDASGAANRPYQPVVKPRVAPRAARRAPDKT